MDWADGLAADVLLEIFHRLDHIDVLMATDRVCHTWRATARDEPSLWRRITMRGHEGIARRINRCGMACEAVRRSAGQCEAFCGEFAGDDGFLIYLAQQSPCLRSLRLISCSGVTDLGFTEVVKALPLLEELELSLCDNVGADGVYEVAGEVCPQLNHFRLSKRCFNYKEKNMDRDSSGIASMRGLRSLQLFGNAISNKGLETILDSCSHLESLDIRGCFNVHMNEILLAKCARIKTIKLSDDPIDDYDLQVESTRMPVQRPDCDLWDSEDYYAWSWRCGMTVQSPDCDLWGSEDDYGWSWGCYDDTKYGFYLGHSYDRDDYDGNYPPLSR